MCLLDLNFIVNWLNGRDHDHMVVGFTTTYAISAHHHWCCEFESRSGWGVRHYVIKFVSDLRQVGDFLRVLWFPPPMKLTAKLYLNIESGVKHHQTNKHLMTLLNLPQILWLGRFPIIIQPRLALFGPGGYMSAGHVSPEPDLTLRSTLLNFCQILVIRSVYATKGNLNIFY